MHSTCLLQLLHHQLVPTLHLLHAAAHGKHHGKLLQPNMERLPT
jgi:hypothetical protein